jgi:tetratricopeptide (TPR) repeat protein
MLEEAVDQLKKTLELEPADPRTRLFLGQAYILNSKYAEGISEILQAFEQSDENTLVLAGLGWAYGMAGRRDEALEVLERLKHRFEKEHPRPYLIAKVCSGMDETDQAFVWLERAFDERDTSLALVKTDESFATLREDPRFDELLRRMNLFNVRSTTPAVEK